METIVRIYSEGQKRFEIEFSSGKKLKVTEDVFVKYQLYKGQEVSEDTLEQLKKATKADEGYQIALRYLSYQLRTVQEIRKYLKDKEVPRFETDEIVKKLISLKLLDDRQYGESYVRTSIRTSDKGPQVVRQQLQKKGLNPVDIDHALTLFTTEEEEKLAAIVAKKIAKRYGQKSYKDKIQKIQLNLMQKGFSKEAIAFGIENLELEKDEDEEWELVQKQGEKLWQKNARLALKTRKLKVQQSLYQKGFDYDLIKQFVSEKEQSELE